MDLDWFRFWFGLDWFGLGWIGLGIDIIDKLLILDYIKSNLYCKC